MYCLQYTKSDEPLTPPVIKLAAEDVKKFLPDGVKNFLPTHVKNSLPRHVKNSLPCGCKITLPRTDYLYTSENIFVQTEPHIHSGCRFPYLSSNVNPVNSTYHLPNLSTQYPQYQNQPLNSPPFFTIDQLPLTHKTKKSGSQNLSSDKPRLPETPCFLHFFAILFFDF